MREVATTSVSLPSARAEDVLTEILREGAQSLMVQAIEAEVADWIDRHAHLTDEKRHRLVVRNGRLPKREVTTGVARPSCTSLVCTIAAATEPTRNSARRSCRRICGRPSPSKS